ncbi:hypothetical protein [Sphingobium sp. SCG-1]|uniref:hypothetical protein n=1 Tax=Sphingobium sp. SCG-1 TaxID=2072936 RepID=UPI00166FCAB3|nr:hypothetical protein [Sphingobium sp. SCG-1]
MYEADVRPEFDPALKHVTEHQPQHDEPREEAKQSYYDSPSIVQPANEAKPLLIFLIYHGMTLT